MMPISLRPVLFCLTVVLLFAAVFSTVSNAAVAEVLSPTVASVENGGSIYLGKIGPGQTVYVTVRGTTTTGGRYGLGGTWQILRVVELPEGWEGFDSKEMATQMQAGIKAASDAADGRYRVKLALEEDVTKQQQLGNVLFYVTLDVDKNVLRATFPQKETNTGVGQPARYEIIIENTGKASDIFDISSTGVPNWNFTKTIHIPAEKTVTTFYEFTVNEEGEYQPTIQITSQSSNLIASQQNVKVTVKSNLEGDIKATKNGVLIFPTVLEPLYALLGLIGHAMG